MINTIFANWRTTLLGILGALALVVPPLQQWLQDTVNLTPMSIVALVLAILGALSADGANKTP